MSSNSPSRTNREDDAEEDISARQERNAILESMIQHIFDNEEEDSDPAMDEIWADVPNELEGEDDEMDNEPGYIEEGDPDYDEYIPDEDDEFFPDEDGEEEDDEDIYIDIDEEEEDGEEDDDDEDAEDEDSQVIDLSNLLQAAIQESSNNDDAQVSNAVRVLGDVGLQGLRSLLRSGRIQIRSRGDDDDEEEEDDDDDDAGGFYYGGANRRGASTRMSEFWDPIEEPISAGQELLYGGEFKRPAKRPKGAVKSVFSPSHNLADSIQNRKSALRRIDKSELASFVPNTNGTEVARYPARCYCGQYSEDSSFFYTCTQDFQVHLYDTTANPYKKVHRNEDTQFTSRRAHTYGLSGGSHLTSLKSIKTIQGRPGSWTITDANLSPDNQWMIYSSITPYVHLVPTRQDVETQGRDNQVMLDFSNNGNDDAGVRWRNGIWSIRFSGDSREIVAGAHFGDIYVYDIEARRRVLKVEGHSDDVNAVAFADTASSNVLISGSDDSFVKVWDRRSLSGGKPAGVFCGHTEGVTYLDSKGDGRYCISNGKDQSLKLWDLRKMVSTTEFDNLPSKDYGLRQWDYRNMYYKKPRFDSHPNDCSVMTYRGHAVLRTLIRCHFSPIATTGQKYIYSGSADGRIHIWSLDGRIVQVLDRSKVIPLCKSGTTEASDPSAPDLTEEGMEEEEEGEENLRRSTRAGRYARSYLWNSTSSEVSTVRDVSWHSSEPTLMSCAWSGSDGQSGSIAKHEWKGFGKNGLSLEDAIEKSIAEADF